MSDAFLFHEADGGNLAWDGQIVQDDGLYTAVYVALFGGNDEDSGDAVDDARQWWGNTDEPEPTRRLRNRTPFALSQPAIAVNLRAVQQAAQSDLAWLVTESLAEEVSVRATAPERGICRLEVAVVVSGQRYHFTFTRPWGTATRGT